MSEHCCRDLGSLIGRLGLARSWLSN
uniref:Uncharacterized protein n=1 Tax=Anguilla anguilla TaxID=7936 RepID=A0A0E9UZ73_ANGAN